MNVYLTKSKVEWIKTARGDFQDLYGIDYTAFTRKIYFYFFIHGDRKYVHKQSLKFVYSNADTWSNDIDPISCALQKQTTPIEICEFLESYQGDLLPNLLENNDKFLVYMYYEGEPTTHINSDEFRKLEACHDSMAITPFYNSMAYNLVRSDAGIKLVDFKHFDRKDHKPFFVYFYNADACVNTLYVNQGTDVEPILAHLGVDYPVSEIQIIEY